jgi:putative sigma-54 modulation protein
VNVIVHAGNADVSPGLRTAIERKVTRLERVAPDADRAEVHLTEERNPRIAGRHQCAITLHLRRGVVTAHAVAREQEAALDLVLEKLRHQVGKRKTRRVNRTHDGRRSDRRDPRRS